MMPDHAGLRRTGRPADGLQRALRFAERLLVAFGIVLCAVYGAIQVHGSLASGGAMQRFYQAASKGQLTDTQVDTSLWSGTRIEAYRESLAVDQLREGMKFTTTIVSESSPMILTEKELASEISGTAPPTRRASAPAPAAPAARSAQLPSTGSALPLMVACARLSSGRRLRCFVACEHILTSGIKGELTIESPYGRRAQYGVRIFTLAASSISLG